MCGVKACVLGEHTVGGSGSEGALGVRESAQQDMAGKVLEGTVSQQTALGHPGQVQEHRQGVRRKGIRKVSFGQKAS